MHRSTGGQVEYWARLGRQIEAMGLLDHERVRAILNGQGSVHDLNPREDAVYVNLLTRKLEALDGSDRRLLNDLKAGGHPVASASEQGEVVIEKPYARR
jgi:hypothetical protein